MAKDDLEREKLLDEFLEERGSLSAVSDSDLLLIMDEIERDVRDLSHKVIFLKGRVRTYVKEKRQEKTER